MVDVNRIRKQMEEQLGECTLSDGELEDMYQEELRAKQSSSSDAAHLEVLKALVRKVDKMSVGTGTQPYNVEVNSEPLRKVCDALAFSVASTHDRVEKALKQNEERFEAMTKTLQLLAEKVVETAAHNTQVHVDGPTIEFMHFDQLNKSLAILAGREAPAPRIKVASPTVNIDMDPVAKSICDLATMLGGRAPQVIVEPSGTQPVIHIHMPKVKRAVQEIIRDNANQIIGSEWAYEYEEDERV